MFYRQNGRLKMFFDLFAAKSEQTALLQHVSKCEKRVRALATAIFIRGLTLFLADAYSSYQKLSSAVTLRNSNMFLKIRKGCGANKILHYGLTQKRTRFPHFCPVNACFTRAQNLMTIINDCRNENVSCRQKQNFRRCGRTSSHSQLR